MAEIDNIILEKLKELLIVMEDVRMGLIILTGQNLVGAAKAGEDGEVV